jgi:hypothetical protein
MRILSLATLVVTSIPLVGCANSAVEQSNQMVHEAVQPQQQAADNCRKSYLNGNFKLAAQQQRCI